MQPTKKQKADKLFAKTKVKNKQARKNRKQNKIK